MKKFIFTLLLVCSLGFIVGCTSCKKEPVNDPEVGELVVENTISVDREYMFLNYNSDYRWYETCVLLKDYLDDENCDGTVAGVSSVFQVVFNQDEHSADVNVILTSHTLEGDQIDVKEGFWVEDFPLNAETIAISFKEAYEKILEVNYPKPHSKHCVLRKEVGPIDANPQYIFGNSQAQLYVDAVTGKVSDKNPVFDGSGFNAPLGEWP